MITNGRVAGVLLGAGLCLCAGSACSSHHAKLDADCNAVFRTAATDGAGTCNGPDGQIHVNRTDCESGSDLVLAERQSGEDYAWARVGSAWHMLTQEQTNSKPFRDCTGK